MADLPTVQATTAERRLALAYLSVFGDPDKRGGDQRLVWADLESFAYAHRLVTEKRDDHAIDIHASLFNDGRRSVWLRARGQIIKALAAPKPPPKISRKNPPTT